MKNKINTIAENMDEQYKQTADLEQALDIAGFGWYNIKYCLVLALFLIAAIVEPVGYSLVLPAAACDLNMTDSQRGFIASIPYIGLVITSFIWGYLVDIQGRKKSLVYSSLFTGGFCVVSAFMPNLITFAAAKFLSSLLCCSQLCLREILFSPNSYHGHQIRVLAFVFVIGLILYYFIPNSIACSAAAPYTYVGEILPAKYRDTIVLIVNAIQISGTALVPLIGWIILPLDFRIDFGLYIFRPWRLLSLVYALFFIISAILLSFGPESPKYLVVRGRNHEALKVLQGIYAKNKKKAPQDYPIMKLQLPPDLRKTESFFTSLKVQTWPLLKPPFLKWMSLNGFLLLGTFSVVNGLYSWVPDVLNRVLTGGGEGKTACDVIFDRLNQTTEEDVECNDTIDQITFIINSIANVTCTAICITVSAMVGFIGKKRLLNILYMLIGSFIIIINFITQDLVFAVLLSSFPVMGLTIGCINAYAIEIFPTHLRGMALGLTMMVGRMGSIIGANVAGVLLNVACEITFYGFGGLLILCACLTFLLPNSKGSPRKPDSQDVSRL